MACAPCVSVRAGNAEILRLAVAKGAQPLTMAGPVPLLLLLILPVLVLMASTRMFP